MENRLPGADANPYLAIAGSLLCGYLGVEEKLSRSPEASGNAYRSKSTLPKTMEEALDRFAACSRCGPCSARSSSQTYPARQEVELHLFQSVVTTGNATTCCSKSDDGFQFRPGHREILLCRDG